MTKADKQYIKETYGENDRSIAQIQAVEKSLVCILVIDSDYKGKIQRKKVKDILTKEAYLSGLRRCAFHRTAIRYGIHEGIPVQILFDASAFFY